MNSTVTFPGLGIQFTPNRVAFTLFGKDIYWYGIIIALGFLLAVVFCAKIAKRFGITGDNIMDVLIFAVPLAIIGARIYYIIFYFSLFQTEVNGVMQPDFGKMIAIWDGGLAIYGGIIAAVLTTFVVCRIKRIGFGAFCDLGSFGLLIGQAVGRWGNFMNREAFGSETALPWRMGLYAPDYMEVHPTFLYESLWNAVGFCLLFWFLKKRGRTFDGQLFLMYIIWYGIGRAMVEGLRTDSLYFFGLTLFGAPIRTSQMLAVLSALAAAGILIWQLTVRKHQPEELYVNRAGLRAGTKEQDVPEGLAEEELPASVNTLETSGTAEAAAPEIVPDAPDGRDTDAENADPTQHGTEQTRE